MRLRCQKRARQAGGLLTIPLPLAGGVSHTINLALRRNRMITRLLVTLTLIISLSSLGNAKPCKKQPVEDLVNSFADSFAAKKMGELDGDRPAVGTVRFVIEHSLAHDNDPK